MAEFRNNNFPELSFYVNDRQHKFSNGNLRTNDKDVIGKVETLAGVTRVDKPEPKPFPKKPSLKKAK